MATLAELRVEHAAKCQEQAALLGRSEAELTAADLDRGEALQTEIETLDTAMRSFERAGTLQQRLTASQATHVSVPSLPVASTQLAPAAGTVLAPGGNPKPLIPASALRSRVTNFSDRDGKTKHERAYQFGMWLLAGCKAPKAIQYCREHGLPLTWDAGAGSNESLVHTEGVNTAGGFLVPPEFENDLIDLREQYGVFRQYARMTPMSRDTKSRPRRVGGLTAYFTAEAASITESTKSWDRVTLTARKLAVLSKYSSELDEDSVINIGNDLAGEISYAFATKEDDCGFNGDGTSTYGGIVGVTNALLNLSATRANIAGLQVGTGNLWSELILADFNYTKGRLPEYAHTARCAWFCSRAFYDTVMEKLMLAAGGVTAAEIAAGRVQERFMGYPVVIAQKMPVVEANDQVCALFGDLSLSTDFGDRRSTTIAMSEHLNFAEDEIAIRGTERFDIVVHDVGNASATAASRQAGPIVGLLTAAS